jgi:hypothetical protein
MFKKAAKITPVADVFWPLRRAFFCGPTSAEVMIGC